VVNEPDKLRVINNLSPVKNSKAFGMKRASTASSGLFLSLKDKKPHTPASKENMLQKIRKHIKGNSSRGSINSIEGGIKGLKPKSKQAVQEVKVSDEDSSTCSNYNEYDNFLRVTFKSDFLYQIGKVCSKSAIMLERALKYLNDFLLIINFYKQDMETKSYHKLRAHA
jgi:hypothetical protein